MAELAEQCEADAATLRMIAARRLVNGDVDSASLLHKLALSFEAQAERANTKTTSLITWRAHGGSGYCSPTSGERGGILATALTRGRKSGQN